MAAITADIADVENIELELKMQLDEQRASIMSSGRQIKPLTLDEIKAIVQREIEDSLGALDTEVSEQRRLALAFYKGKPFGNEQEGRSSVILQDVRDTIEWIMPSLMRIFTGGAQVVRFDPTGPEDEEAAEQATDVINKLFYDEMDGFNILYDMMKTGLIEKRGICKVYYEERFEPKKERYHDLDENELAMLLQDGQVEPVAMEEKVGVRSDPVSGQQIQVPTFDVEVVHRMSRGKICIDGVPPEEFLIARRAITLDDYTGFAAHRKKVTASDLISMGHDPEIVINLPVDNLPDYAQGRIERLGPDQTVSFQKHDRTDPASREIWVTDCYLRIDEDGDGFTELRRILAVGEQSVVILDDQEVNWSGLVSICPVPIPYKFFGFSVADLVMDLQLIRSTLLRQMLDNLYLINNSRYGVVDGQVEIDDLLTSRPGGIVRQTAPGMIEPLQTTPLPPMAMNMMDFLETVKENRTGVTKYNQGLDANSLNKTATGISSIMNAAMARIELIARIYAEGGLKDLFKKILRVMIESPMKERVIRLKGKWVSVDPSSWNADMNVSVQVGLGVGQASDRIQQLMNVMQIQGEMHAKGLGGHVVTPENVYNAASKVSETMGFKMPDQFFTDPQGKQPPPPKPDPRMVSAERRAEEGKAKLQLEKVKIELDRVDKERDDQFRRFELDQKTQVEIERIKSQERIAVAKCQIDIRKGNGQMSLDTGGLEE